MIKNYGIFNNHELDNTLLIKFLDSSFDVIKKLSEEMEVLYKGESVVGYRISNFIRYAKIKYSGIIFLPANPLIDVINSVLDKYHLELLEYKNRSGYITKRNDNRLMVYAVEGTFLRDGHISKGKYCSYYDLYIDSEDENALIEISEAIAENTDFFKMEEK